MTTGGKMGHPPTWYRVISAARYLGVPPWELTKRPAAWVRMAESAQRAENIAREQNRRRQIRQRR